MTCSVYVAVGPNDEPLYVGVTGQAVQRFHQHSEASLWWEAARNIKVFHLPTRQAALDLESFLIAVLHTDWNVAAGVGNITQGRRLAIAMGLWPDANLDNGDVVDHRDFGRGQIRSISGVIAEIEFYDGRWGRYDLDLAPLTRRQA